MQQKGEKSSMSKIRIDFVTNSSSSSFVIQKRDLTGKQIEAIRKHKPLAKMMGMEFSEWGWDISENDKVIEGYTSMDNFSMDDFFKRIGVSGLHVKWNDDWTEDENELEEMKDQPSWEELLNKIVANVNKERS
jgi:hypothetical protein